MTDKLDEILKSLITGENGFLTDEKKSIIKAKQQILAWVKENVVVDEEEAKKVLKSTCCNRRVLTGAGINHCSKCGKVCKIRKTK